MKPIYNITEYTNGEVMRKLDRVFGSQVVAEWALGSEVYGFRYTYLRSSVFSLWRGLESEVLRY
jgi:hypothetical protein